VLEKTKGGYKMPQKLIPALSILAGFLLTASGLRAQVYSGAGTANREQPTADSRVPLEIPQLNWVDVKSTLERQESELRRQLGTSFDEGIGRSKEKIQLANRAFQRLDSDLRALEQKLNQLEKLTQRHNSGDLWLTPKS
jgi:hypothetical protein